MRILGAVVVLVVGCKMNEKPRAVDRPAPAPQVAAAHADTCPGAQPWGSGQRTCEHDSDCGSDARCYPDGIPDTSGMCGAAPVDEINCDDDHRCKRGEICQPSVGRCGSRVTRCEPGCTLKPCADGTRCGKDGQCTPIACTDGYACKAGTRCGGRNPDEHGCAALGCWQGGDACPPPTECKPNLGCTPRACTATKDCPCGACMDGTCATRPGICGPAEISYPPGAAPGGAPPPPRHGV